MRILLVGAGASYSIKDVENGYHKALKEAGEDVIFYDLDGRIEATAEYMNYVWRRHKKQGGNLPAPSTADVLYGSGIHILEKALRFMPDWILVVSGMFLHPDVIIMLKRAGFKVAMLLTESPYDEDKEAVAISRIDVAFTNERTSVAGLSRSNPNVYYLPHAYDPMLHYPSSPIIETKKHDVVFVGTGFTERCQMLEGVNWSGIDLGLYGQWPLIDRRSKLHRYISGGITDNAKTSDLYRAAKIGLNLYRTSCGLDMEVDVQHITTAESMNPRALELAACGVFTLSDYRPEVEETFGIYVPTFEDSKELELLVRTYLHEHEARVEFSKKLPDLVTGRTYAEMTKILLGVLKAHMEG